MTKTRATSKAPRGSIGPATYAAVKRLKDQGMAWSKLVLSGIASANDARLAIGLPPLEGFDVPTMSMPGGAAAAVGTGIRLRCHRQRWKHPAAALQPGAGDVLRGWLSPLGGRVSGLWAGHGGGPGGVACGEGGARGAA